VEAPFREWTDPDRVDPYFFAEFVKTTAEFEVVAALIEHKFHDAARILEIAAEAAEPTHAREAAAASLMNSKSHAPPA
jgi:hypothetical protein